MIPIQKKCETPSQIKAAYNMAELVTYNTTTSRSGRGENTYHSQQRETPLAMYIGLVAHAKTHCRDLVDALYDQGLSVSYDRVMTTETALANSVIDKYKSDGVVCPQNLRKNLLTTGMIDNVDHNPSSTTSQDSFHGTSISLIQHASVFSPGTERAPIQMKQGQATKTVDKLPDFYALVPPASLRSKKPTVPKIEGPVRPEIKIMHEEREKEQR